MFHLFIKVINIEVGTKHLTQPETSSSVSSPAADEQFEPQGVSCGEGWLGLLPRGKGTQGVGLLACSGGHLNKASLCLC